MGYLRSGYEGIWGHLRTSLGRVLEGSILRSFEVISGPYSRPYLRNLIESRILPSYGRG